MATPPLNSPPPHEQQKAKRITHSFAKKYLIAGSDLFLDPSYSSQFNDATAEVIGQVKECPRESNGRMFTLQWKNPLPSGLQREWLRCKILATQEVKDQLIKGMMEYDKSEEGRKKAAAKTARKTTTPTEATTGRNAESNAVLQTPAPVQHVSVRAFAASLRTSSTVSSLSQHTISSPEILVRRGTRRTEDIESSSDDGDDLDEEDNMYNQGDSDDNDLQGQSKTFVVEPPSHPQMYKNIQGLLGSIHSRRMQDKVFVGYVLAYPSFQEHTTTAQADVTDGYKLSCVMLFMPCQSMKEKRFRIHSKLKLVQYPQIDSCLSHRMKRLFILRNASFWPLSLTMTGNDDFTFATTCYQRTAIDDCTVLLSSTSQRRRCIIS